MVVPTLFLILGFGLILTIAISKLYMKTSFRLFNMSSKFSENTECVCKYTQENEALDKTIEQLCYSS